MLLIAFNKVLFETDKFGQEQDSLQARIKRNTSLCANDLELKLSGNLRLYGIKLNSIASDSQTEALIRGKWKNSFVKKL